MEEGKEQVRGVGLAPSPRTLEEQRIMRMAEPTSVTPVWDSAPAAVVALRESLKAIHFQFYGQMIDLFDLLATSERQSETLHRRGMKVMHDHLAAMESATRSILIKGEIPADLTAAVMRVKERKPESQEENRGSTGSSDTRA
jgi:hypothetical protein